MKRRLLVPLALASAFITARVEAISLDDIPLWTGSGTNRAALVVEWSAPEVLSNTAVPVPVADKTLVWGYRFNGKATGMEMLQAIVAADPRLYVAGADFGFGTVIAGIGYNLKGDGNIGLTDGVSTNFFTNRFPVGLTVDIEAARPINPGDLYWGGWTGPNWEAWNETGGKGGFLSCPQRGTNPYWRPNDTNAPYSGLHGQWQYAWIGDLALSDGSWVGFSVAAGADDWSNESSPATLAFSFHKHAPPSPDGTYTAYVCDTNDFAVQIVSTNNVYSTSPYNDPTAVLGRPTLKFINHFGGGTTNRVKLIEASTWTATDGSRVITEIANGGQITVNLGRKVYDDPNNPYGVDFIIYGNSFFSAGGASGAISDGTDLNSVQLSSGFYGHPTVVSVSQDGTHWFTFPGAQTLFPDNAYRWDEASHSWTDEPMNPTKPLNPSLYSMNFGGSSVADGLEQFMGATGGSGYDLKASGLPWIQYVRIQPAAGTYTVIDAIAAVNPVAVGDALLLTPDNLASGITNFSFQKPSDLSQNLISLNFNSVSDVAKVSTIELSDLSSFAPVAGSVSRAYQITVKPVAGANPVTFQADVGLRAGENYSGNGNDLRVFQWNGATWTSQAFRFDSAKHEALVAGITNSSVFVISAILRPQLSLGRGANGICVQFTPVPNCSHVLERSTDLVTWTPIATIQPTNSQPVTLPDGAAPPAKAFYRLRVQTP